MKKAVLILGWLLLAIRCQAEIITVDNDGPADFNNIQAAINAASTGDTVIVTWGRYTGVGNRDIDLKGKAITVRSQDGHHNCIIDCEGIGRGFYLHGGEGENSVIAGFTITNGYADSGGGIYCSSSPTITNCTLIANSASQDGGGLYCAGGSPTLTNCMLSENRAGRDGGGLYNLDGSAILTN